jgi:hypothetical protein
MLELFEIILQIRTTAGPGTEYQLSAGQLRADQLFFVPSLLSDFDEANDSKHPALSYWHGSDKLYVFPPSFNSVFSLLIRSEFVRRFEWTSYPSGLFPRILLRIFHTQLIVMACWLDAAVVMSRKGKDCAFLHIAQDSNRNIYFLEVALFHLFFSFFLHFILLGFCSVRF